MSTGFNGTPMPGFLRRPDARATMGDHGLHRLPLGEQRAWLFQPRRRQARPGSDRSGQGRRELRIRACGPLSDHRADHGARTRVPSSRDLRDRSGHLRCGVDRPPRSMARHERGEDGEERAVASRAAGGGGSGCRPAARAAVRAPARGERIWRRGSRADAAAAAGPLCRGGSGASRPAIRVLRRRLDPDSVAGADGRPQALLHLRRRPELGGSLVLRSGPARSASVHRQGKRGHRAQRHGRSHWCRELRPGRMVGHLQAAPSRQPRAPRSRPSEFMPVAFSVWDGFSRERGNRRGLTVWYSLYVEPEVVPSAVGPMVRTALFILAIELAVIGWVRWRYGSRRDELGGDADNSRPRACELPGPSGGSDVQEHLRSRR